MNDSRLRLLVFKSADSLDNQYTFEFGSLACCLRHLIVGLLAMLILESRLLDTVVWPLPSQ